jgi:NAD(P)-dependent dehydrogenase (short-subunit alcohol dehydrogenase family)
MSVLDSFALDGKTAVVTGAARGLGEAISTALAEAGANIVIVDLDEDGAHHTAETIGADTGVETEAIRADITDEADVEGVVEATVDRFGGLDIQVNNAGVAGNAPAEEMPLEEWQRLIEVNQTGVFLCAKHAGRQMLDQGSGSIINMASMSGLAVNYPQPQVAYNASKAGVIMITRSMASEWADRGVRVNAIAPGYMRTELVEQVLEEDPEMAETWRSLTPMDRLGRPEDLKGLAVFLASDASPYVTGEIVVSDGGYTVR